MSASAPEPIPVALSPAAEQAAREELARLLSAPDFAGAGAHQRLLRFLVERTLQGQGETLKETLLAIEVFQRPAERFDPRSDSIVRVEARRLRERLQQHYAAQAAAGAAPRWSIELHKGSYRPRFVEHASVLPGAGAELVERGHYFLRLGHEEGHRKALARFEEAAQREPTLAAAHSGVARAWTQLVTTTIEPPLPGVAHALAAVKRALALAPEHVESLVLAAQLMQRFEFDWPAAQALYERAERAERGALPSGFGLHAHAFALMLRGAFDAAEALLLRARQRDTLNLTMRAHTALLHFYRRDWARAEAELRAMLDLNPGNALGMSLQTSIELARGEPALALQWAEATSAAHPRLSIGLANRAQALALLGRADEARALLHNLQHEWQGGWPSPYQLAMVHVRLGEMDAALAQMARAIDERDPNAITLPVDPTFDALRALPAGQALVRRVLDGARARHHAVS